jgi:hypothetical protein
MLDDGAARELLIGLALSGEIGEAILQRERGARRADGMVRLVAAAVEDGGDSVADDLLHLAAELTHDQRGRDAPVGVEHFRHLRGR